MHEYLKTTNTGGRLAQVPYTAFFLLLVVFLLAQPFDFSSSLASGVVYTPSDRAAEINAGSLERQIGLLLLALFAILSLRPHRPSQLHARRCLSLPVLMFLSWACMSIIWSDDPSLTVRRVGVLLILCLGAVAVGTSFSYRDVLLFTFLCGMATVVGGLFTELALHTFHPFKDAYRFAGIMHPNFTGWNCSLCLIAIVALSRNKPRLPRLGYALAFVAVAGCQLLTGSERRIGRCVVGLVDVLYPGIVTTTCPDCGVHNHDDSMCHGSSRCLPSAVHRGHHHRRALDASSFVGTYR